MITLHILNCREILLMWLLLDCWCGFAEPLLVLIMAIQNSKHVFCLDPIPFIISTPTWLSFWVVLRRASIFIQSSCVWYAMDSIIACETTEACRNSNFVWSLSCWLSNSHKSSVAGFQTPTNAILKIHYNRLTGDTITFISTQ